VIGWERGRPARSEREARKDLQTTSRSIAGSELSSTVH